MAETTALAGSTTESLRNIELVKSLGLAQQEIGRLNATTDKILQLELKKVRYLRSLSFIQGTCVNALRTGILGLMLYLIFAQQITFGQFFALWIYSFFIFGPLQELGNIINVFRESQVSLNNFEEILRMPPEPQAGLARPDRADREPGVRPHELPAPERRRRRRLRRERSGPRAGETIALVGPSGSGKTTLVKLLVGLYHPRAGRVRYNGVDSEAVDLDRLRERIGFVTQDTQLFSGTHSREPRLRQPLGHRRGVPGRPAQGGLPEPAGAGAQRASTR